MPIAPTVRERSLNGVRIAAAVLLVASAVFWTGDVRATTGPVEVVLLVPDGTYHAGDFVNVTVHVFVRGAHANATTIRASVACCTPWLDRPIPLAQTATGVYEGRVRVLDVDPPTVAIAVNATVEGVEDRAGLGLRIAPAQDLLVSMYPSPVEPRAGDTVHVTIRVRVNGVPHDADFLNLSVGLVPLPAFGSSPSTQLLNWTQFGVGNYTAAYVVPTTVDRNSLVQFIAEVTVGQTHQGLSAFAHIRFPPSLLVWYQGVAMSPDNATLDLHVADATGGPISGASVSFSFTTDLLGPSLHRDGSTDASGVARFALPLNGSAGVSFAGTAKSGTVEQPFAGFIQGYVAAPTGFVVRRENPQDVFESGELADLRYIAMDNGTSLQGQTLYVYVYTSSELLAAEQVATDASGRFDVRFVAPAASVSVDIAAQVRGLWTSVRESFQSQHRLAVQTSSVPAERRLQFSGRFPSVAGPWIAFLSISASVSGHGSGVWQPAEDPGTTTIAAGEGGEAFQIDVTLPRLLPDAQEYTVEIVAIPMTTWPYVQEFHVFRGTARLDTSTAASLNPWVLAVLLLVPGIVFFVMVLSIARSRRAPRDRPPTPPE